MTRAVLMNHGGIVFDGGINTHQLHVELLSIRSRLSNGRQEVCFLWLSICLKV
jgi:hypothetical protein